MNLFPNKKGCIGNEADCNDNESCQSVPIWGSKFPEAYHGHSGQGCSGNCSTKIISSDRVSYTGPNLPCTGINTCTSLTQILQMLDEWLCSNNNPIPEHNQLEGLQGGDPEANEFYHLDARTYETVINLQFPDGLLSGGLVQWSGVDYIYNVSQAVISIGGNLYTIPWDEIILEDSDSTFDRIDVIYVTQFGFGVLTGTPASDPVMPQVDPTSQIFLTSILVTANTTQPEPGDIDTEDIYQENEEWIGTSTGTGATDFESTTPKEGSFAIESTNIQNGYTIVMDKEEDFDITDYSTVGFWIRLKATMNNNQNLYIGLSSASDGKVSTPLLLNFNKNLINEYQFVAVPTSAFNQEAPAQKIYLEFVRTGGAPTHLGFFVDVWTLQGGITQPPTVSEHDELDGIKGLGTWHLTELASIAAEQLSNPSLETEPDGVIARKNGEIIQIDPDDLGGTPNLQEVADEGNITTTPLIMDNGLAYAYLGLPSNPEWNSVGVSTIVGPNFPTLELVTDFGLAYIWHQAYDDVEDDYSDTQITFPVVAGSRGFALPADGGTVATREWVNANLPTPIYKKFSVIIENYIEQDWGDTPLTSGLLEIDKYYYITTLESGDDFTNVGFISEGEIFKATGTTPTDWSNGTEVWELEVNIDNDKIHILENTTGETVDFLFSSIGASLFPYIEFSDNILINNKTVIKHHVQFNTNTIISLPWIITSDSVVEFNTNNISFFYEENFKSFVEILIYD